MPITVFGLAMKTELLLKRNGRGYKDIGEWRCVAKTVVWQFVNRNATAAGWLEARADQSTLYCDVDTPFGPV